MRCFFLKLFRAGLARSGSDRVIPWLVTDDKQLLVAVESSGKSVLSLADLICRVCRSSGITSLNLLEHDMIQKAQQQSCSFSLSVSVPGRGGHADEFQV